MDEYIRLDTTAIGIDNLIAKASNVEEANALFKAKDVIYSQQRYLTYSQPEPQPVKHGRWMYPFYCLACGFEPYYSSDLTYNYCPNCGAKMDGGDE